eukprot:Lithocolla_globosa_v1_NODE_918_length_3082_cov_45.234886.p2 type:complete len:153 gc:universal NODE_918_length_3082_cov_45.234886:586-128(-)
MAVLYKAFIRSKMEYCSPLWIGASGLNQLDRLQRRCCRILGFPHQSDIPEMNVQGLEHRRLVSGLCLFYRMWFDTAPPDVCTLLPPLSKNRHSPRCDVVPQTQIVKSNSNYHQTVPHFSRVWNLLPSETLSLTKKSRTPLQTFKRNINKIKL